MSSDPIKDLVNTLGASIKHASSTATAHLSLELGTITARGLKLDRSNQELDEFYIPDYLAESHLSKVRIPNTPQTVKGIQKKPLQLHSFAGLPSFTITGSQTGLHAIGSASDSRGDSESIDILVVNQCTWTWIPGTTIGTFEAQIDEHLKVGDRVLVACVNNGHDWVVIERIVPYAKNNGMT